MSLTHSKVVKNALECKTDTNIIMRAVAKATARTCFIRGLQKKRLIY